MQERLYINGPSVALIHNGIFGWRPKIWLFMPCCERQGCSFLVGEFRNWEDANRAYDKLNYEWLQLTPDLVYRAQH